MENISYNNEIELLNDLNIEARSDLKTTASDLIRGGLGGYGLTSVDVVTEDILSETIARIVKIVRAKKLHIKHVPDRDKLNAIIINSVKKQVQRRQRDWASESLTIKEKYGKPPACRARTHFDSDAELIAEIDAIRNIKTIEPKEIDQLISASNLSKQETELLNWVRVGLTDKEIGIQLGCSAEAAKKRRQKVIQKLKQNTRHLD